jgi:ATP-dependent DNA ligase
MFSLYDGTSRIASGPQQEFMVCGFTEGKGSRGKSFGALLLGAYPNGKLNYFGHSGTDFSEQTRRLRSSVVGFTKIARRFLCG